MNRVIKLSLALLLAMSTTAAAQVKVGDNINVLPVYKSTPPGQPPGADDYLRGDLFAQRQTEPTVAVSTVNRDHIVTFFNDYRAVDQSSDQITPDTKPTNLAARVIRGVQQFLAKVTGQSPGERGKGKRESAEPELAATGGEAWIGMSVSYDGGITWTGGVVPGHHDDLTDASVNSPAFFGTRSSPIAHGGSDPVLVSAPCGRFYLAYMSFVRGGESRLLVSRFQDLNDSDSRHTIAYLGTSLVDKVNNATNGLFVDKPHMAVELTGNGSCSQVTENIHVSYTTFVGGARNKFTSKINVASSYDGGKIFTPVKIDDSYTQSQGTALAVDQGRKILHLFWRSFTVPNSVIYSRKAPGKQWSRPVDLLASSPMVGPFDQTSLSTLDTNDKTKLRFRANGFPTAAMTADGSFALVAWQERANVGDNNIALPSTSAQPRIVLMQLNVKTGAWSPRKVVAPTADADLSAQPYGFGFFRAGSTEANPQVMPSLACGPDNTCVVTYYESRSPMVDGWIAGYDTVLDRRGAIVKPGTDGPTVTPSFQVSRYGYEPPANWTDVASWLKNVRSGAFESTPETQATQIRPPWGGQAYASLNYGGYPHTGSGTTPYMGDYGDTATVAPFVFKGGKWEVPTLAADVPSGTGFVTVWSDNRFVIRPANNDGSEWLNFGDYQSPGSGNASCTNPGSRDSSVMAAQLSYGLLLTSSTNYKPYAGERVSIPVTIWNNTGQDKVFTVGLSTGPTGTASFAKDPCTLDADTCAANPAVLPERTVLYGGERVVFAYSSSTLYVYINDTNPVTMSVAERCAQVAFNSDGSQRCDALPTAALTGSVTLNSPAAVTAASSPQFYNEAPLITASPTPKSPTPKSPTPKSAVPADSSGNPIRVYDVIDYSVDVTVANAPADMSSFLALFNIDKAYQDSYIFQLFVTKPTYGYDVLSGCDPANATSGTLVAHISDPSNPLPKMPTPKSPTPKSPTPKSASLSDAILQNSTFTMAPTETSYSGGGTMGALVETAAPTCDASGAGIIGYCTKAAPRLPGQVTLTLRAYQVKEVPTKKYQPYGLDPDNLQPVTPPSLFVAEVSCTDENDPKCVFLKDGPELTVNTTTTGVFPSVQQAGQPVTFAHDETVSATNQGNWKAQAHRSGYYISAAATAPELPRNGDGTIKECPGTWLSQTPSGCSGQPYTRLIGEVPVPAGTEPGFADPLGPVSVTIPSSVPPGLYYLWAYADFERVVSEFNEDDNLVQGGVRVSDGSLGPIQVLAPGYGFIGLQSPCYFGVLGDGSVTNDPGCVRNGGGAVPIAWQFSQGGVAADTWSLLKDGVGDTSYFNLKFYPSGANPLTTAYLSVAQPEPSNITTGNSGFQYFATAGSTRPQYTWQFNWDRPDALFPPGHCYDMWIEVLPGQVLGSTDPALQPLGPVKICLQ